MQDVLKLTGSVPRLKPSLIYGKDYVIIPQRVWRAFTKWYGGSTELKRKIIVYPL